MIFPDRHPNPVIGAPPPVAVSVLGTPQKMTAISIAVASLLSVVPILALSPAPQTEPKIPLESALELAKAAGIAAGWPSLIWTPTYPRSAV